MLCCRRVDEVEQELRYLVTAPIRNKHCR
jgi:hypothetical protein